MCSLIFHLFHLVTGVAQLRICSTLSVWERNAEAGDQPLPNWKEHVSDTVMAPKNARVRGRAGSEGATEAADHEDSGGGNDAGDPKRLWKLKVSGRKDKRKLRSGANAPAAEVEVLSTVDTVGVAGFGPPLDT